MIDQYGVTLLQEFLDWGHTFLGFLGKENFGKQRFKNGKIHSSKFVTVLPKVTKTGSIVGQRIWGMGSEWPVAYTQKKSIHVPPLLPLPPLPWQGVGFQSKEV